MKHLIFLLLCTVASAATPRFSIPGGLYTNDLTLQLTANSSVIRFTLDGSEPTTNSDAYSSPIVITNSMLVRARAFEGAAPVGPVVTQTYILLDSDLVEFNSNLPLILINTFGQGVSHDTKVPVSVRFIACDSEGRSLITGAPDFEGRARLNTRGHSSLQFPKHSFDLKTIDEAGAAFKAPVLGFPSESDWVLYAPYPDKTLMRDVLAYELSRELGHYAPRTKFVEVFASRSDRKLSRQSYLGVYVFEEWIKRSKERVNVAKLKASDNAEPEVSGGYIFKKDHERSPGGFRTSQGVHFYYVEPKEADLTTQQKEWLTDYLNRFEEALYGSDFKDPAHGYAAYIDVDSFVDYHWIVEFSKNVDGYRLSNYLQKDRNGKLKMEPIWDWNLSFGNADFHEGWLTEGWYWPLVRHGEHFWFERLFEDPDFKQKYIDRWAQLRTNQFATSNLLAKVDTIAMQLQEAQQRNFRRWRILNRQVWPNWYVGETYADEVNWMKDWIKERLEWIDGQLLPQPAIFWQEVTGSTERLLTLRTPKGEIYYTLDGKDPRESDGAVSREAQHYTEAVPVSRGAKVCARARFKSDWSAQTEGGW